jgi:hypothetical protein
VWNFAHKKNARIGTFADAGASSYVHRRVRKIAASSTRLAQRAGAGKA